MVWNMATKKASPRSEQRGSSKRIVGRPFEKGRSGNPGGRPKEVAEVRDLAREHTTQAIETLVRWMQSDNAKASVAAANVLLDRGWGKPSQPISGDPENPLQLHSRIEFTIVRPSQS